MIRSNRETTFFAALFLFLASSLSGCAKRAAEIEPASINTADFSALTCSQLVAERAWRTRRLAFLELEQDQINADDRIRTFGIPTPMGSLYAESKVEAIANLKAQLRALGENLSIICGPDYR
jgi:hypothetical protein